jgi:hypothetical protein
VIFIICKQCSSKEHRIFKHSVYSDDVLFCNQKVENVECRRCICCGTIVINEDDLKIKSIKQKGIENIGDRSIM